MNKNMMDMSVMKHETSPETSISRSRHTNHARKKPRKVDYGEFLWMSSGAVIVGLGIYMFISILS